jgi:hypothetical protein
MMDTHDHIDYVRIGFYETEPIYNTPPGSSSSEKLQMLYSPYGIHTESTCHINSTIDLFQQFNQESIVASFEPLALVEQSIYHPIHERSSLKAIQRYESSLLSNMTRHQSRQKTKFYVRNNDLLSSPLNSLQAMLRQQEFTSRTQTNLTYDSPLCSTSPCTNRSTIDVNHQSISNSSIHHLIPSNIVDGFILNTFLNDSLLNIFRDINFDASVLCPCKQNELSIHGQDAVIYLNKLSSLSINNSMSTRSHQSGANDTCTCGFSAIVNLRSSSSSGLFYEDEIAITGMKMPIEYRSSDESVSVELLRFIEQQQLSSSPFDVCMQTKLSSKRHIDDSRSLIFNDPFYRCKFKL